MPALTEWLQLMLAEIARKRDEAERAREEELRRRAETAPPDAASPPVDAGEDGTAAAATDRPRD